MRHTKKKKKQTHPDETFLYIFNNLTGEIPLDTATIEVKEKKDYFVIRSPSSSKPWWIKCDVSIASM